MKPDTSDVVVIEQTEDNQRNLPIEETTIGNSIETPAHKQFFKITQLFGVEAPLLP